MDVIIFFDAGGDVVLVLPADEVDAIIPADRIEEWVEEHDR